MGSDFPHTWWFGPNKKPLHSEGSEEKWSSVVSIVGNPLRLSAQYNGVIPAAPRINLVATRISYGARRSRGVSRSDTLPVLRAFRWLCVQNVQINGGATAVTMSKCPGVSQFMQRVERQLHPGRNPGRIKPGIMAY